MKRNSFSNIIDISKETNTAERKKYTSVKIVKAVRINPNVVKGLLEIERLG